MCGRQVRRAVSNSPGSDSSEAESEQSAAAPGSSAARSPPVGPPPPPPPPGAVGLGVLVPAAAGGERIRSTRMAQPARPTMHRTVAPNSSSRSGSTTQRTEQPGASADVVTNEALVASCSSRCAVSRTAMSSTPAATGRWIRHRRGASESSSATARSAAAWFA